MKIEKEIYEILLYDTFKARHIDIVIRQQGMERRRKISYVTRIEYKKLESGKQIALWTVVH